jgi:hypothetical protein
MLPPRRLTHKDAKIAAKLYGLTYDEVRAREYAHNEEARRKERVQDLYNAFARNGIPAREETHGT